ncbi:MAG: endonuclease/exonuclease/phosphatase family protein [Planctomycetota bacterium]|nr:endonuclease/exonuclease/phosphatase family protein [Planctomycetota bacterium]
MRYLGVMLCVALLVSGVGCVGDWRTAPPARAPTTAADDVLRVLTYNIHHGAGTDSVLDLERIARVITDATPDLVGLQEVDNGASRTGDVDQAATLGSLTGMHHAFAPFMDFQGGQYGLAVLSKHPIVSARVIDLPPGRSEPRSALAVEVAPADKPRVTIVCLHFDWLEGDAERFAQAQALIAALDSEDGVILAGDFNDTPDSRTIRAFEDAGYAIAQPAVGNGLTFPADLPTKRIDFVMHRPAFAFVGGVEVLDEKVASDHRPVLAVLEWTK